MDTTARRLIEAEIDLAKRRLEAARLLFEQGFAQDAVSRAYYAAFHAARAALTAEGVTLKSHAGVASMFSLHLVKAGIIEPEFAKILRRLRGDRSAGDYDPWSSFEPEAVEANLVDAAAFIARIERHLAGA